MTFGRICVFAGSSTGARPEYLDAARELGSTLVSRGIGVVYGGAKVGLMGALADAALAGGGHVTGVIPSALVAKEIAHQGLSDLRIVSSMHERKATMAELSDGFIALPGGVGTLEELFEVITWGQLGLHRKPCGLLNVCRYYDPLLAFLDHSVAEGFVRQAHAAMLQASPSIDELLDRMAAYEPPTVPKWLDRSTS